MPRPLVTVGLVLLLSLLTLSVVWAGRSGPPPLWILEYGWPGSQGPTGRVARIEGIEFVEISGGCFRMGSTSGSDRGSAIGRAARPLGLPLGRAPVPSDEMPVHWDGFRRPFWIARCVVTNETVDRWMGVGRPPRFLHGDSDPALGLDLDRWREFCRWISGRSGLPIRLPSEAEWECACRAGTRTGFGFGDDEGDLSKYAWFGQSPKALVLRRARPVGQKLPNAWGLHDMHGNVFEWCGDEYHRDYVGAPRDGSAWDRGTYVRAGVAFVVCRGGGIWSSADDCRSAARCDAHPRTNSFACRPAFALAPDQEPLVEKYLVKGR